MNVRYFTDIDEISEIPENERVSLKEVTDRYSFRVNDYYLSLINWDDPDDPIRKIIIPETHELSAWGALDPSNEAVNYVVPGCQHKYPHTALILVNEDCGGYCRFCFRKRLFSDENAEVSSDVGPALDYIASQPQISNVLLTGGDPLILSSKKLEEIIRPLRKINHVQIIRIGTKMPAFNPTRIIDDPELPAVISRYSTRLKRIYFMTHFNHPREITDKAALALDILLKAGAIVTNQTPVLRGINHEPEILTELMEKLSYIGVPPYYFFQCRPTAGNKTYAVPITETYTNLEIAKSRASGLARRAKHVMSHATGKMEVVGVTDKYIYLKYHRARKRSDDSRMLVFKRNDKAYWLDDFQRDTELVHNHAVISSIPTY
ncbi:MAG: KamA family radical SAM protein [candidate division Zixibacteria bacterium]